MQIASNVTVSDAIFDGFLIGVLFSMVAMGITGFFFSNRQLKYEKLVRWTKHLIDYENQIVTVADLVFKTELSPQKCKKFLDKFVVQLDGDIHYTETGKLYYQFPTANNLDLSDSQNYQKLLKWTEHLLSYNNQIVTVMDLALKTEFSPEKCRQFLEKLVAEVDGEIGQTESGKIYYQFPIAKTLEVKKLIN